MKKEYLCESCTHKDVCKYIKEHMELEEKLQSIIVHNYVPFVKGAIALCEHFIHT